MARQLARRVARLVIRLVIYLAAPLLLGYALPSLAATGPAPAPAATSAPVPASAPAATPEQKAGKTPTPEDANIGILDVPRDYLSNKLIGLIGGIDDFFGTDINYQEANDSVIQMEWGRITGYTGERRFYLKGRAKVHLPRTEKRLHLLVESDPDKDLNKSGAIIQPSATGAQAASQAGTSTSTPTSYAAGVRLERSGNEGHWHASTEGGMKFAGVNTTPFARMRGSYEQAIDGWSARLSETLFWFNTTGAGATSQLDFERKLDENIVFRATSISTWSDKTQTHAMRQDFILMHKLNDRDAMQYQASVVGTGDPRMQTHVTDDVLLVAYRRRIHKKWMFMEISPQLHFPRERGYRNSGMLSFKLEMLFDKSQ